MINKFKVEYWFTLKEVMEEQGLTSDPYVSSIDFYSFFHTLIPNAPLYKDNAILPHLNNLMNLLYSRNRDHYCFKQETETISQDECLKFITKMANVIVMTYDRYSNMLDLYLANKGKLMNPIKSSSEYVNRYNDTPQNSGDFDDDSHTTNINHSKSETSTDGSSMISRLNEIEKGISDLMKDWTNEFNPLFIEEV